MEIMKGAATLAVLRSIKESFADTTALLEAFLRAGYGASYGKLLCEMRTIQRRKAKETQNIAMVREAKQKFHTLMYRLKRDGLLHTSLKAKTTAFHLTPKGALKLQCLEKRHGFPIPAYEKKNGNLLILIIFDIPEKEKKKRVWLRNALRNLGFQIVQKSVWIGKTIIPTRLVEDLHHLALTDFVEILEISKRGSLRKLF